MIKEKFDAGIKRAEDFIEDMLSFADACSNPNNNAINLARIVLSTNWYLIENRSVTIHGERGVSSYYLEKCKNGIKDYILKPFNIKMKVDVHNECEDLTSAIYSAIGDKGIINNGPMCGEAGNIFIEFNKLKRNDSKNLNGNLFVTKRQVDGGWGLGSDNGVIISSTASSPELITAHEFIHYLDIDRDNCSQNCLMNYNLREDGKFCDICEDKINSYISGINSILNRYGSGLNKDKK